MRLSTKKLLIVANPFAAPLSQDGKAMALCPVDPSEPMGRDYIGASTSAKTINAGLRRRSVIGVGKGRKPLTRDKIEVVYSLAPVTVHDTPYYRRKIEAGEVFEAGEFGIELNSPKSITIRSKPGIPSMWRSLRSAARAALTAFEQAGGSRSDALAAWRAQGLGAVADMIEQRTSHKRPKPTPSQDAGTEPDPGISPISYTEFHHGVAP